MCRVSGEAGLFALCVAQPAGVVVVAVDAAAQLVNGRAGADAGRMALNLAHGHQDVFAQRHVAAAGRVDIDRVQPETAGLKAVVGVDQVVVFSGHEGLFAHEPCGQRLDIT